MPVADGGAAGDSEDVLTRWSRRKARSRRGGENTEDDRDAGRAPETGSAMEQSGTAAPPEEPATSIEERADDPSEDAPELPPIESLDEESDYSAFLSAGVPADLQREALRKLFHSPKFNVRDGLDDYDLDFSKPQPLGEVITAELRHRMMNELERMSRAERDVEEGVDGTLAAAPVEARECADEAEESAPDDGDERTETA